MGSSGKYFVLMAVNKKQEESIRALYKKKKWTYTAQNLPEAVKTVIDEFLEKLSDSATCNKKENKDRAKPVVVKDKKPETAKGIVNASESDNCSRTRSGKKRNCTPEQSKKNAPKHSNENETYKKRRKQRKVKPNDVDKAKDESKMKENEEEIKIETEEKPAVNCTALDKAVIICNDPPDEDKNDVQSAIQETVPLDSDPSTSCDDISAKSVLTEQNPSELVTNIESSSGEEEDFIASQEKDTKAENTDINNIKDPNFQRSKSEQKNDSDFCKSSKDKKIKYNGDSGETTVKERFELSQLNEDEITAIYGDPKKRKRLEDGKVPIEHLPIQCFYCRRRFAYEKYLKKHVARVHPNKTTGMFCEYCSANFKKRPELYAHIKEAHPLRRVKNIQCDLCGNVFKSKGAYDEHRKAVHTERREFICDICQKAYKSLRVLKIHKLRHGPANEICNICGKTFRLRSEVKHHMRRHLNDRRIQCNNCDKFFYRNSELKNHQRIHTGERPYKCTICLYSCSIKGNLDKHLKTHEKQSGKFHGDNFVPEFSSMYPKQGSKDMAGDSSLTDQSQWLSKDVQLGNPNMGPSTWHIPSMDRQEKDSVETLPRAECNKVLSAYEFHRHLEPNCSQSSLQQGQLKNYESLEVTTALSQIPQQLAQIPAVSQHQQGQQHAVVGAANEGTSPDGQLETPVYTQMKPPETVTSLGETGSSHTSVPGLCVMYPEHLSQWQTKETNKQLELQPIYSQLVHKNSDPEKTGEMPEWNPLQPVEEDKQEPGSHPVNSLHQPVYTQLKAGDQLCKNDSTMVAWAQQNAIEQREPGPVLTNPVGSNEIVIENYNGRLGSFY